MLDTRLAVLHPPKIETPGMQVALTINDPNVLQDYHSILIPKAVEYSAGMLDYFFRGTLGCGLQGGTNGIYAASVTNTSSQTLSGGAFHLYSDDARETRTEIASDFSIGYSSALSPSAVLNATFSVPADAVKLFLVFQGSIGTDPVDAEIAVSATSLAAPQISTSLPVGSIHSTYTGTITSVGIASPTFSLATGSSLPPGLSMDTDGNISGTPTDDNVYDFTVIITDGDTGAVYQMDLSITISDPFVCPPDDPCHCTCV